MLTVACWGLSSERGTSFPEKMAPPKYRVRLICTSKHVTLGVVPVKACRFECSSNNNNRFYDWGGSPLLSTPPVTYVIHFMKMDTFRDGLMNICNIIRRSYIHKYIHLEALKKTKKLKRNYVEFCDIVFRQLKSQRGPHEITWWATMWAEFNTLPWQPKVAPEMFFQRGVKSSHLEPKIWFSV